MESLSTWGGKYPDDMGITGTGAEAFQNAWPCDFVGVPGESPMPQALVRLCRCMAERGETSDPLELLPLYIRRPDARARLICGKEAKSCG